MQPTTNVKTTKSLQYYARAIHRVLGYLILGLVLVYGISGITLIYRTGDFLKHGTPVEETLAPHMSADALGAALKMKGFKATEETAQKIYFADGQYDKATGQVSYIKKEVVAPINRFIDLHKAPVAKSTGIAVLTTIFGIVMLLMAITALFMFKPAARQFKANMIYVAIGVALAVVLLIIV